MSFTTDPLPRLTTIRLPWEVRVGVSRMFVSWKENNRGCAIDLDADFGPLTDRRYRRVQVIFQNATRCFCQDQQRDDEVSDLFDWSDLPDAGTTAAEFRAWQDLYRQSWERDGLALDSSIYRVVEPVPELDNRYTRFLVHGHDSYLDIWAEGFEWKELYDLNGSECLTVSEDGTTIVQKG